MNTKVILAITVLAATVAALAAVTAIQFVAAQTPTATLTPTQTVPQCPYLNGQIPATPGYCYNGTATGAQYGCHGNGYGAQGQYQYGAGMMGGAGFGMMGRGW